MSKVEKKIKMGADLNVKNLEEIRKIARDHNNHVKEAKDNYSSVEYHFDLAAAYKGFKRLEKSEKTRGKRLEERSKLLQENRELKHEQAKDRLKILRSDHKEHFDHLMARQHQMNSLIKEVKEAFKEEVDQKKEISLLKKKDQIENYERGKNFHNLYKQKLVERLLEKKERAERVKDQQRRIASMCATQRVRVSRTMSQAAEQIVNPAKPGTTAKTDRK